MKQLLSNYFFSIRIIVVLLLIHLILTLSCNNLQTDLSQKDFNIVLITIDTLRADHLSCYGYHRKTSPTIDKIAEKGIIFKNAIAPSSWTAPSMVSLLTSVYPINHGVIHGIAFREEKKIYKQDVFSDELTTLAKILKEYGYSTFGVASNSNLHERFGFARGFDYFKCLSFLPAPDVNKIIYSWEDEIRNSKRFFLWVHYFDPHQFYQPRDPWIKQYTSNELTERLKLFKKSDLELLKLIPTFKKNPQVLSNLTALYDSEINYVDLYIRKLIKALELDKNTLIIITSDHGEGFLEHDQLGHANNLYQETIHIPLIVKLPNSIRKTISNRHVNLIDIMPTILDILDINPPEQTIGKSFLEKKRILSWLKKTLLRKDTLAYIYSELERSDTLKTIMTSEWKYIYNYKSKTEELYNIKSDPLEKNDLAEKNIKQRNKLREQLFDWVSSSKKYPTKRQPTQLSPEEKEKLRLLGYIQ